MSLIFRLARRNLFQDRLRFGAFPSRILGSASENAFGIYVLHYPFVVWLQYALLGTALFAVAKGAAVFAGTLLFSWTLSIAFRATPVLSALIGGERRARAPASQQRPRLDDDGANIRLPHIAR